MSYFIKHRCAISRMSRPFIAILFIIFLSCEKDDPISRRDEKVPKTIVERLKNAGFDTSEGLFKFQDGYIVEYDIFLTEDKIESLLLDEPSGSNGRTKHYRSTNLVHGAPRTLLVFMDPTFNAGMQDAFDLALERYNTVGLRVRFVRTMNAPSAHIRIDAQSIPTQPDGSEILGFSAGFPEDGNPASPIVLNTRFFNTTNIRTDAITVIAHEIGHAIGFRHTDYMNRTFSCGSGGNEGSAGVGAVHIPNTPTNPAANSWMLACSNNTDRPFTQDDVTALRGVYPQWDGTPFLWMVQGHNLYLTNHSTGNHIQVGTSSWLGTNVTGNLDNTLYIVQDPGLYRINPSTGGYTRVGTADWTGTQLLTSLGGNLYMVQGDGLYRTNPTTGAYTKVGTADWTGASAMTSNGSNLFIIQGYGLYSVNPSTGGYTRIGMADWTGSNEMAYVAGFIYILNGQSLYKVVPSTGVRTLVGTADWSGSSAMASSSSDLFIIQGEGLYKVNLSTGGYIRIGTADWSGVQTMTFF